MIVLSFHLKQAATAFPQSMGWGNDRNLPFFEKMGTALAVLVFAGYVAIPIAVLFGLLELPQTVNP
jgi:succinate dehydrogenase / fumarate reductase cytochrome b subunit